MVHQQKRSFLHVREPGHYGGLQGVKIVMVDPVDDLRPSATSIFLGDCEKTLKRTHHNTFDTLKVADFVDIEAFKESKV